MPIRRLIVPVFGALFDLGSGPCAGPGDGQTGGGTSNCRSHRLAGRGNPGRSDCRRPATQVVAGLEILKKGGNAADSAACNHPGA